MFDYRYAYLFGNLLIGFPIWLFLFWRRRDLRKEMLMMSILIGFLGPLSEFWYRQDYWMPLLFNGWPIGFEDYLFGFFAGGISGVVYEEVFVTKISHRRTRKHHWPLFILPLALLFLLILNVSFLGFHLNSIYASIIGFLLLASIFIYYRKDLLVDALSSGILSGLIMLIGYFVLINYFPDIFQRFWLLKNISGITIYTVPIEEIAWAFSWGMVAGPMYEFFMGLKFRHKKRR